MVGTKKEQSRRLFFCPVPKKYVTPDGFEPGKWIQEQRSKYLGLSIYEISDDRIDMLEEIGMFWKDLKNAEWDWFVGLLRECSQIKNMGRVRWEGDSEDYFFQYFLDRIKNGFVKLNV